VLHDDYDLSVRTFGDGVPDGQAVGREMESVGAGQRVCFGKGLGERRVWFVEQMEDRRVGGVAKRLR